MRNDFKADAEKDPDELEREVDQQREYIYETLTALEQRFSPGQIFDQVLGYMRRNGGDFSHNLVDTVKANPVPTLLTATGLAWLITSQNRSQSQWDDESYVQSNASYGVDAAYDTSRGDGSKALKGKAGQLKDKAGQLRQSGKQSFDSGRDRMHHMQHSAQQGMHKTRQGLHDARDSVRHQAQRAGQGFNHLLHDQPLALGALGIALGALIGASIPRTQKENALLGEKRDQMADKAKQTAQSAYQQATDVGTKVAEDAKQETEQALRQSGSQSTSKPGGDSPSSSPRYN